MAEKSEHDQISTGPESGLELGNSPQPSWPPRCHHHPPCLAVLESPSVLQDRTLWPNHLCPEIMQLSTERWAFSTYRGDWKTLWPLPLTESAIRFETHYWARQGQPIAPLPDGFEPAVVGNWAWAAFIVQELVDWGLLELFFTMETDYRGTSNYDREPYFCLGPVLFRLRGLPAAIRQKSPAVARVRQAEEWWDTFPKGRLQFTAWRNMPRKGGAPIGNRTFESRDEFLSVIGAVIRALAKTPRGATA
jgi:hypothetical protein